MIASVSEINRNLHLVYNRQVGDDRSFYFQPSRQDHLLPNPEKANRKKAINIKYQGKTKCLNADDIVMIVADSNYSKIYMVDGKNFHTSKTLKVWQHILNGAIDFTKPHRSYLVNTKHILGYISKPRTLVLTGNVEIPIARRFYFKQLKKPMIKAE